MKWALLLAVIIAAIGYILVLPLLRGTNNVCKTFEDYYSDRDKNENCYYNPDYKLEVPDIIRRNGYPAETHFATTEDGYILSVFRIPHGRKPKSKPGKPIFIQHGLTLNSGAFVNTGKKSLGFVLADAGYDVWLGNFRGSKYSQNHTHFDTTGSKFWDFSFHEHGIYDVPAQLDLISQVTKQRIIYIGYSMGTMAGYVYTSTYPDFASEKIEVSISLAPAAFFRNLSHVKYLPDIWHYAKVPIQALTNGKVVPKPYMPQMLYKHLCFPLPVQMKICQVIDMYLLGFNYEQSDPETLPITMQINIDATSIKTMTHLFQLSKSSNFEQYDYGKEENKKIYGSPEPPHYDLSKIKVPHYFIYAENDAGSTKENVLLLYSRLHEKAKNGIYGIKDKNFNHLDIASGKDAKSLVFVPIISFLDSLKN